MQEKWFPSTKYSNNNNKKYRENLTTDLISFFAVGVNFLWGFLFYLFVLWMGRKNCRWFLATPSEFGWFCCLFLCRFVARDWLSEWVCDGATDHSMLYNSSWHSLLAGYTEVFMPFYAYVLLLLYIFVFPYAGTCFQVFILFMLSLLSFLLNFSIFQHFV